jgi:hypothetical protein
MRPPRLAILQALVGAAAEGERADRILSANSAATAAVEAIVSAYKKPLA